MIITLNVLKEDISKKFLNRLFESNPVDEVSKLMKPLTDFHDVTFNFYDKSNRIWYSRDFKQF